MGPLQFQSNNLPAMTASLESILSSNQARRTIGGAWLAGVLAVLVWVLGAPSLHAQISFAPAVHSEGYSTPGSDRDMAFGDLDLDGDLDAVLANDSYSGTVVVLFNNGSGTLVFGGSYSVGQFGSYPSGVALADLDGDGSLDIAVAVGDQVRLFCNDGAGSFVPLSILFGIHDAISVALADLDGDADPDVVATSWNFRVYVAVNNGDGTFQPATSYQNIFRPRSQVLGDLDRDGDLDVITAGPSGFTVLPNNGDATFAATQTHPIDGEPWSVDLGDLDHDGDLDIALGCPATYKGLPRVAVVLNHGSGTFTAPVFFDTGSHPMGVAASDLDLDGDLDLAVADNYMGIGMANNLGLSRVTVLENDGGGGFFAPIHFETGPLAATAGGPWSIFTPDLTGDGYPDLVSRNKTGWPTDYTVSVLLNESAFALVLTQGPLYRGAPTNFTVTHAQPGELVYFLYSLAGTGAGPCPGPLGGLCLDLLTPIIQFGSAVADANGQAVLTATVPPNAPAVSVSTQAVARRGVGGADSVKSKTVSDTIQ